MYIRRLELYNYRNYSLADVTFDPGINVIRGLNGQGKTNILEAVAFLSTGRAFRSARDANVIRFDTGEASLRGRVIMNDFEDVIQIRLAPPARKQIIVNDVKQKSVSGLSGRFGTVLFCPEDMELVKGGSANRREFLDCAISQLRVRYAEALKQYRRLHESKLKILKSQEEKPSLLDTLDDFSLKMCQVGAAVIGYRAAYLYKLKDIAKELHFQISGGREELELCYRTVSTVTDPLGSVSRIEKQLEQHYFAHKRAEIETKSCLSGPHKDDIAIHIAGRPVREFGSQGQTRTAVLAMKLAERQMYRNDTGLLPVLLLDDVLSELDEQRQAFVLGKIEDGQVIITCSVQSALPLGAGKAFLVENGTIREEDNHVSASGSE